jgi:hypothetical protein
MAIYLLDNSLKVEIYFDPSDSDYDDNICISIVEECPDEEKLFLAGETNMYLTPEEACQILQALAQAVKNSNRECGGAGDGSGGS